MWSSGTDVVCGYQLFRCSYTILYCLWLYNEFFIILYNILRKCWVRLLSHYNIKYTCTIYTRLDTCLMSISRIFLQTRWHFDYWSPIFFGADVVERSRAIDIRLSDYFCSASMVWGHIQSREEHKFDSSKTYNANTVWFNFQTYI